MSILPIPSPQCFNIFKRSMIQADHLPLSDLLDSSLIAKAFEEDKIVFGIADEDVFTPAITLWAMVSQFLFSGTTFFQGELATGMTAERRIATPHCFGLMPVMDPAEWPRKQRR
jgi:hypothetical protein